MTNQLDHQETQLVFEEQPAIVELAFITAAVIEQLFAELFKPLPLAFHKRCQGLMQFSEWIHQGQILQASFPFLTFRTVRMSSAYLR